jgi:hypothetical protein
VVMVMEMEMGEWLGLVGGSFTIDNNIILIHTKTPSQSKRRASGQSMLRRALTETETGERR